MSPMVTVGLPSPGSAPVVDELVELDELDELVEAGETVLLARGVEVAESAGPEV